MNYEETKEHFEQMTSSERLQTLTLMWPDLDVLLQVVTLLMILAVLGLQDVEVIGRLTHYLSDDESPDTSTPIKE